MRPSPQPVARSPSLLTKRSSPAAPLQGRGSLPIRRGPGLYTPSLGRAGVKMSRRWDIPRMVEVRVLRGGLALDALYFLARDVDGTGEPVGLEHPALHHILDLPRSEVEILGRLPQGEVLAFFVFDPTNLLASALAVVRRMTGQPACRASRSRPSLSRGRFFSRGTVTG